MREGSGGIIKKPGCMYASLTPEPLVAMFRRGRYKAIATDDAKFIRILQATGIPCVLPALLIFSICRRGLIDKARGLNWLDRLSPFISEEEYSVTKLLLEEMS
jgi:hypothetical protein